MPAIGTLSLVFSDDITANGRRMNSEVYRTILSAQVQANASILIGQQGNDPKHSAKATKMHFKAKNWKILDWPSH